LGAYRDLVGKCGRETGQGKAEAKKYTE